MALIWTPCQGFFLLVLQLIHSVSSTSPIATTRKKVNDLINFQSIERIESSNLKKASNLVIDSNPRTCLKVVSSQSNDPRWIQLHFREQYVFQRLNVIVRERKSNISIFIVVELSNNRTKFSRCTLKSNSCYLNQTHFDFQCPGVGYKGRKIFIRDDEKDENAFYVCEVQAFGVPASESTDCSYRPSIAHGMSEFVPKESTLTFSCKDGYILWGRRRILCRSGIWLGRPPTCRPLSCNVPPEFESENTIFKLPRNISRIQLGDTASVHCKEGLLLIANSTQGSVVREEIPAVCSRVGTWEIKTTFNCVNSSTVSPSLLWTQYSALSIIQTVSIGLSLFLLFVLLALTLYLYKRNLDVLKEVVPEEATGKTPDPLSRNSDRDTSTTTIYDEDIQIPDSGSLIRGPPVDDASFIREECYKEGRLFDKKSLLFKPKPLSTFKPNQNVVSSQVATNYCVAWTQSLTFSPSDESGLENVSLAERSSISCLPDQTPVQHIYANVRDNHPGYTSILPRPPVKEAIYANDPPVKVRSQLDNFDYSQFQSL